MMKRVAAVIAAMCSSLMTVAAAAAPLEGHPEARAYRQAAEQRFRQHLTETKQVGMTVCSINNRIGYIEQIAGPRIKVEVRGYAGGRYSQVVGPQGPFDLDSSMMSLDEAADLQSRRLPLPVKDPYFFYQGQKELPILPLNKPKTVWEMADSWATCTWTVPD